LQTAQPIAAGSTHLLEAGIARRSEVPPARERAVELAFASGALGGAVALALLGHADRGLSLPLALLFTVAYAALARIAFNLGDGYLVPTQVIFVPMLLLLPTPIVPLLVVIACALTAVTRVGWAPARSLLAVSDAGYALAPALVLIALGAQRPDWGEWPAYLAALAAQFACDAAREALRARLVGDVALRTVLAEMTQVYRVDAILTPIGLVAAVAAADAPAGALLVLPMMLLLAIFARERDARIGETIELSRSYRGTALLLRDLLEEDDEYTGHHTEDVVELSVRVAEELRVGEAVKRETELGALLHDIGKIHIPDAIINKPGKLDEHEWAIMKTHTIEGQKMLDRVGGMLSNVGVVVRASHERFDGGGYPDGLAAEDIPLAARIVAACDSFNAMTTTRSYRKALPVATAVDEMNRCSGTQFDPRVVDALLRVVSDPGFQPTVREAGAR
jgi:putative nucleotidyltransferase with HDIG domain